MIDEQAEVHAIWRGILCATLLGAVMWSPLIWWATH